MKPAVIQSVALEVDRVSHTRGPHVLLDEASASFATGALTIVHSSLPAERKVLAELLLGMLKPERGRIYRDGPAPPFPGVGAGFNVGGPAVRGLTLRAAAYGLDPKEYIEHVAGLMRAPGMLRMPLERLSQFDRTMVLFGSTYMLPCKFFVLNNDVLPLDGAAVRKLRPLFDEARSRAAIIWVADRIIKQRIYKPDLILSHTRGKIVPM